jgi:hypothetical protein
MFRVGAGAPPPVGRVDGCTRRYGRAPERVGVGAKARLFVGCGDVLRAVEGGDLAVLQWARKHDCPWNQMTCEAGRHLRILLTLNSRALRGWRRAHGWS